MSTTQACVSVVDDDALVLKSLDRLLQSAGFAVRTFSSGQAFLEYRGEGASGCILIDLSMPGLNGLELQRALAKKADLRPVVFMSGQGSIPTSVEAMKAGAVDFLTKPFDDETPLGAGARFGWIAPRAGRRRARARRARRHADAARARGPDHASPAS
jgi:FixJ family two-component response regulator